MKSLDPWKVSLTGTTLIEASAGTGKTYTLTTLYLRMIVEFDLLPSQILVVTYTQAATAELRDRLRARIRDAIRAGEAEESESRDDAAADEDLRDLALAARARAEGTGRPDALRRALQEFDEAAIFTIHGFCQRMLTQSAFETQVAFDAELIESSDLLLEGVARDLWARAIADQEPRFVAWLLRGAGRKPWQFNPEKLKRDLLGALGPDETMPIRLANERLEGAEERAPSPEALLATWQSWVRTWSERRAVVSDWLLEGDQLNKRSYAPDTIRDKWLPELDDLRGRIEQEGSAFDPSSVEIPKFWTKLTREGIQKGLKKGCVALDDPAFDSFSEVRAAMTAIDDAFDARALRLRLEFVEMARAEAQRRRDRDHRLLFDDLLSELRRALASKTGPTLAARLRAQFPFALIDEFQDTDPVQYEIFSRVWHAEAIAETAALEAPSAEASG